MCRSAFMMLLSIITVFVVYSPLPAGAVELQAGDLLYMGGAVGNTLYRLDTVTGEREVISGCFVTGGSDCLQFPDQFNRGTGPIWQSCPDACHASALPDGSIAVVGNPQSGTGQPSGFTLYIVDTATGDRTSIANTFDGNGPKFDPGAMEVVAFEPPDDPDPEKVINGCVKNKNGALRIVTDPADCSDRETPISWVGQ